ncbi:MAG: sigma-70 family RNA polymerase sigma factor [Prevotella sp.]|jgi:RNA polymerase sigma-70 factor (ECF subfamily)|nr:sigma-70 family RNA polymerase sigma factor [Prevotella sp.]
MSYLKKEHEFILGLKRGEYDAFDSLYNFYSDYLYSFILRMTKSPSESEDILQDTFLKVWYMRETISPDKSFKSFLFTISRNLIIDSFRAKINSIDFEIFIHNSTKLSIENSIEEKMNYDDFLKLLSFAKRKLTDKQCLIFDLKQEKGYSNIEIAESLGLSEKTIRNQLSIIINIIKKDILISAIPLFIPFNL